MKIRLFTHTDLDGTGCAIIIKTLLPDVNMYMSFETYKTIDKNISDFITNKTYEEYDLIFITDIAPSEETATLLDTVCCSKTVLLDHHVTATYLNKFAWANVYVDIDGKLTCGTSLLFKYLLSNKLSQNKLIAQIRNEIKENLTQDTFTSLSYFVGQVRLYDTWEWKTLKATVPVDLNTLRGLMDKFDFVYHMSDNIINNSIDTTYPVHMIMTDKDIESVIKENRKREKYFFKKTQSISEIKWKDYNIAFLSAEQYTSDLADRVLDDDKYDIVAIFTGDTVSLRTKKDIDVSEIAKAYGGGGHKQASGFTVTSQNLCSLFSSIFV